MGSLVPITNKLEKLVPRLASDADGEIIATVRAIDRTLKKSGCSWHDLTAALKGNIGAPRHAVGDETQSWGDLATWCRFNGGGRLSLKERTFIADMSRRLVMGGHPTPKQADWLRAIYAKLKEHQHG